MPFNKLKYLNKKFYLDSIFKRVIESVNFLDKTVLDIGCGNGYFLKKCSKFIKNGVGIELNKKIIENVKVQKNLKLEVGNAEKLKFSSKSFDIVTGIDILEHASNPKRIISEAVRISKKYVIFTTANPSYKDILYLLEKLKLKNPEEEPFNSWIDSKRILKMFDEIKLKNVIIKKSTFFPFPIFYKLSFKNDNALIQIIVVKRH